MKQLASFLFLPAALVSFAGCNPKALAPKADVKKEAAATKSTWGTVKPVRKSFMHKIEAPGEIQAFEQTPMYSKISGYVKKVHKDIGDRVHEGEVLAELAVPEMQEEFKQKEALVLQAKKGVERARKMWTAADANLKVADAKVTEAKAGSLRAQAELSRAESQYERMKKNPGVIAAEVLAETKLGYESARATMAEVDAKIKSAEAFKIQTEAQRESALADIDVAQAHLDVAQAVSRHMAELLKYAQLQAPFPGVIIRRGVDPGHFVQSSASGNKGEPVFVVARFDPVRVFVDVPENDAVLVEKGTKAFVRVQALKSEEFPGSVTRSAWALDPKARILRTEIDLPNPGDKLRPGMYANAVLVVEHAGVWSVPNGAILSQGGQSYCVLVQKGKARRAGVLLGFRDNQFVEILKIRRPGSDTAWDAVTGDDVLMTGDLRSVSDGQAVADLMKP